MENFYRRKTYSELELDGCAKITSGDSFSFKGWVTILKFNKSFRTLEFASGYNKDTWFADVISFEGGGITFRTQTPGAKGLMFKKFDDVRM